MPRLPLLPTFFKPEASTTDADALRRMEAGATMPFRPVQGMSEIRRLGASGRTIPARRLHRNQHG